MEPQEYIEFMAALADTVRRYGQPLMEAVDAAIREAQESGADIVPAIDRAVERFVFSTDPVEWYRVNGEQVKQARRLVAAWN